jgi:GT2 family glycosyltransferase/glycosyltransferase involved in cell wall biosynthesis
MSSVGGGRFIRGFLTALCSDPNLLKSFGKIYVLATQAEDVKCLGELPPCFSVVKRRFPGRLRYTPLARLFGLTLPAADIAFGPFLYSFPLRARARVITLHDLSLFNLQYHPTADALKRSAQLTKMVHECDGVVCISNAVYCEFKRRWPYLAHKAVMIYNGVSDFSTRVSAPPTVREHSILAVGTIEPRKNYPTLLDAFERLLHEQGDAAPLLTVVGNKGWLSDHVVQRLTMLEAAGRCRWLQNASDEQLRDAYGRAGVFSFLSLSEGFGYPPFEAALARCPMVLSNASSVGEIWSDYAKCVDPYDVESIVAAWKWAFVLTPPQREAVVARQERRAREFTWSRAVNEYMAFWSSLVCKDSSVSDGCIATRGMESSCSITSRSACDISIIIVNYNTCALLRDCLRSVQEKTSGLSYEIIVVDNASGDSSCQMLENEFPDVHLIRNQENLGFSKANNQAIKKARGEYVLLLNSDTVLENNAIGIMHDFMQAHPRAAVCGPLLLNADNTIQRSIEAHMRLSDMILRLTLGLSLNRAPWPFRDAYHTDSFHYSSRYCVPDGWLTGAVLMIRKVVFSEVGLLDEKYFFMHEDADWELAAARAGWEIWFIPEAAVQHFLGSSYKMLSAEQEIALKIRFLYQNRYYVFKNLGSARYGVFRLACFCCCVVNLFRRVIMASVSSPDKRVSAVFKMRLGWKMFLASIEPEDN